MTPEHALGLACTAYGRDPATASVLRAGEAVTVAIDEEHVVRVLPAPDAGARRALAAARLLPRLLQALDDEREADGALLVPYPRVAPGLAGIPDLAPVGAALAEHHAPGRVLLAAGALDLPRFDPAALADRWLARAPDALDPADRAEMEAAIAERWARVDGDETVLHGDAHPANWAADHDGRWLLLDPEFLAVGPAVYDLAPLEVVERRLGAAPSRFASFREGYEAIAGTFDDEALAAAIGVRELLAVAWLVGRSPAAPSAAEEARRRLPDALAGGGASWRPAG